jgi:ATP-binding cassette subfamily F protein 3
LLLDEPTNHLDLATREALSMALNEFEGTVMLVSHDRALLRAVCDEFWMVGRGAVGPFDGDLDDYQRYLLEEAKRQRELAKLEAAADSAALKASAAAAAPVAAVKTAPVSIAVSADPKSAKGQNDAKPSVDAKEQRKQDAQARQQLAERTRPLKREIEQIDQRLSALVAERADLEQRLTQPLPPAEIADLGRRLKTGHDETARLEERWLEISAELEEMGANANA